MRSVTSPRGEHHHRHGAGTPDRATDLETVLFRKHDVENDEIGPVALKAGEAVGRGRRRVELQIETLKVGFQQFAELLVIVDEQDSRHVSRFLRAPSGLMRRLSRVDVRSRDRIVTPRPARTFPVTNCYRVLPV